MKPLPIIPPVPARVTRSGDDWPRHKARARTRRRTRRQEATNAA